MAAGTNAAPDGRANEPPALSRSVAPHGRRWFIDEIVVAAFAFLGFAAAVFLPLRFGFEKVTPIQVSFLLATGLAALTYRYLGGIQGASFAIGALKLGGTLAALVGIAMLINSQLVRQIQPAQVWYLKGKVVNQHKNAIDELQDADFSVFPSAAHADQLGDFHVEFIHDERVPGADHSYLKVNHKGFGPLVVPLDLTQLKTLYPYAQINDRLINIDHIVLAEEPKGISTYVGAAPPPQPLQPGQITDYTATAQSAKPADPMLGGLPQ